MSHVASGFSFVLDTVLHQRTGLLFDQETTDGLMDAVEKFESIESNFDPQILLAHAASFSEEAFKANLVSFLKSRGVEPALRHDLLSSPEARAAAA